MKNVLTKTENKNGTFTYTVTDSNGVVISTRTSKRGNYVACEATGLFYWSRVDLIGKGDSMAYFKNHPEEIAKIAYLKTSTLGQRMNENVFGI